MLLLRHALAALLDDGTHVHLIRLIGRTTGSVEPNPGRSQAALSATIAAGGPSDTSIMAATVIDKVTPSMRIYDEESFGPVVCVIRVDGEEEAIRIANDTEYGLSSAVYTKDIARGMKVARRIESGICHINGPTVHDEAQMPFRFGNTLIDHLGPLCRVMGVSACQTIKLFPKNEGAGFSQLFDLGNSGDVIGKLHRPLVPLRDIVQIPDRCRCPAIPPRHDCQPTALRETCALHAKTETAKVRFIP